MIESETTSAVAGRVRWSPLKSSWTAGMLVAAVAGGIYTFSWGAVLVFLVTSAVTLCLGHSLGMHRRFIHNSYQCPKWLEYAFVHLGVLVGMAGPLGMMKTHDMRDWAQRRARCHDYFGHRRSFWVDAWWQMHCDIELDNPPRFAPPTDVANDRVYQWMERSWMWQQLPWALLLFAAGGVAWVIWGICVRVSVSIIGHWLVGHFAHNEGHQDWHVAGASVQGYNVSAAALLSFGECWHNNHHAFPGSAKLGLSRGQLDPGWWVLKLLEKLSLVHSLRLPGDLPPRPELRSALHAGHNAPGAAMMERHAAG